MIEQNFVSDIRITYRPRVKRSKLPVISTPEVAYKIAHEHWDKGLINFVEQFKVLMLSHSSRLLGIFEVSKGGISGTMVDPRVIFIAALKSCASSIILIHNHPSGNLKASDADRKVTDRIMEAGSLLGITLLDHLIISDEGYLSFMDKGYLGFMNTGWI